MIVFPRPGAWLESASSISAAVHRRNDLLPIVAVDTATGACAGACASAGGGGVKILWNHNVKIRLSTSSNVFELEVISKLPMQEFVKT